MGGLFSKPKMPTPPPEAPPPPSSADDQVEELKKRKKGDKANLMTGGLGLSGTNNLYVHTLGGSAQLGTGAGK